MLQEDQKFESPLYHPEAERLLRWMDSLAWQVRTFAILRMLLMLFSLTVLFIILAVVADYEFRLDDSIRAVLLGAGLVGGYACWKWLAKPFLPRNLDLRNLALLVERKDPSLGELLSSAVHFLVQPESSKGTSSIMQVQVISAVTRRVAAGNLGRGIGVRGLELSFVLAVLMFFVGTPLLVNHYPFSVVGLKRLLLPYSDIAWPTRTQIELANLRNKIGANETLNFFAKITGDLPREAVLRIRGEVGGERQIILPVERNPEEQTAVVQVRMDASTLGKQSWLSLEAGDAKTPWSSLVVLEPPVFIPPKSGDEPAWVVRPPSYTLLGEQKGSSFGSTTMEVPRGSQINWSGRVNRPVVRSTIEFMPETRDLPAAVMAGFAMSGSILNVTTMAPVLACLTIPQPSEIDESGQILRASFSPLANGIYRWVAEDEQGLFAALAQELHIQDDPSPQIEWKGEKNAGQILLLPQGAWNLQALVQDPLYGIRSIRVESTPDGALFDKPTLREFPLESGSQKGLQANRSAVQDFVLKPSQWKKRDGTSWKPSERFSVRLVADDHDSVLPLKNPGASPWIEVRIADKNSLELALEREQEKARQELLRARKPQSESLASLEKLAQELKESRALGNALQENLSRLEQEQRLLRDRLLDKENGLTGELEKARKLAQSNDMKASSSLERIRELLQDLNKVDSNILPAAQKQVSDALRKLDDETMSGQARLEKLQQVMESQKELDGAMVRMLEKLEPFAGIREMRSDARDVMAQMEEMQRKLEDIRRQTPQNAGKQRQELDEKSLEKLDGAVEQQAKLERGTSAMLEKMEKASRENSKKSDQIAQAVQKALQKPEVAKLRESSEQARRQIEANQLSEAIKSQEQARESVQELLDSLEDRSGPQAERLARKLKESRDQLQNAREKLDQLKAKKGSEPISPKKGEMEQLASQIEETARNLSRMNDEFDPENLEEAAKMLRREDGEKSSSPVDNIEAVKQRLQREIEEIEKQVREAENQLQRERLEKIADTFKQLLQREEALVGESLRLDQLLKEKGTWSRAQLLSIASFVRAQAGLAEEIQTVSSRELEGLPVFAKVIGLAQRCMVDASRESARNPRTQAKGPPMAEKVVPLQRESIQRLSQFLDSIREEMADLAARQEAERQGGEDQQKSAQGDGGQQGAGGTPSSKPPSLAQLKLLRNLQADLLARTSDLSGKYPNPAQMTEDDRRKMIQLQKDQREVGELMQLFLDAKSPELNEDPSK